MDIENMSRHQLIMHKIVLETRILNIDKFIEHNSKYCNKKQPKKYMGITKGFIPNLSIEELNYEKDMYRRKIEEINRQIKKLKFKENYYIENLKRCSGEFEATTLDKVLNEGDE